MWVHLHLKAAKKQRNKSIPEADFCFRLCFGKKDYMYERVYTLRYGDLDRKGNAKLGTIFDILQDISTRHSEDIGYDMKKLYSMNIAFLLKGWRIRILEPFNYYSDIVARTGIMKIRHFETIRKYELWQDGVLKLIGTGNWMPVNTETKRIMVCPDEIKEAYECIEEKDNNIPFIRVREEENAECIGSFKIQKRDIDTNGHVNNVKSIELAMEGIDDKFGYREIQVTYVKELKINEEIFLFVNNKDDSYQTELKDSDGKACVLINVL